jgi:hypothetical protein
MTKAGYYKHLDGERYPCEVVEETETLAKVRFSGETAKELRLAEELWLPKHAVKGEGDRQDHSRGAH